MKMKTINVRDFQRNISTITDEVMAGQSFTVLRNAKPAFDVTPSVKKIEKRKKFTQEEYIAALNKMQFHSGEKNLSGRIDEIVYK